MSKRSKVSKRTSKKLFTSKALKVNPKNSLPMTLMRGGIRL